MKQVAGYFLPDSDRYFEPILQAEGNFQISHLHEAVRYVPRREVALDIGANSGLWTVTMAKLFRFVYAFEPAADCFRCLVVNTADYPNVTQMNCAVGNREGFCALSDSATRPGNTGARFVSQGTDIPMIMLDKLTFRDGVDFVKIDVEGYEENVVRGGEQFIKRYRPVILLEEKRFKPEENRPSVDHLAAGRVLQSWGMRQSTKIKNDAVYIW